MRPFELLLFSTHPDLVVRALTAGVHAVVVDWERVGKERRQRLADTEISEAGLAELQTIRGVTAAPVLCRINRFGPWTADEIEAALDGGADEILLPMVSAVAEVDAALGVIRGRARLGILVETVAATRIAAALAARPLSRVYVGLNDLSIDRGTETIFAALVDGTVERLRAYFDVPFGFGGLTAPEAGHPIPCRLLIGEMARLQTDFSVLRRSFHRDMAGRDLRVEVPRLLAAVQRAFARPRTTVLRERDELAAVVALVQAKATAESEETTHPHERAPVGR